MIDYLKRSGWFFISFPRPPNSRFWWMRNILIFFIFLLLRSFSDPPAFFVTVLRNCPFLPNWEGDFLQAWKDILDCNQIIFCTTEIGLAKCGFGFEEFIKLTYRGETFWFFDKVELFWGLYSNFWHQRKV